MGTVQAGVRPGHDPDSWHFEELLKHPEYHLHETLKNEWTVLYWLMRYGERLLEVGAGSGRTSILAKRLRPDKRVVAVDVALQACRVIRQYRKVARVDLPVIQADALNLPFPNHSFDVSFSSGVLEHYPNDWILAALREQTRVAEAVIFSVPLDLYVGTSNRVHGDERMMSKIDWLKLAAAVGPIADVSFTGTPGDEMGITVTLYGEKHE